MDVGANHTRKLNSKLEPRDRVSERTVWLLEPTGVSHHVTVEVARQYLKKWWPRNVLKEDVTEGDKLQIKMGAPMAIYTIEAEAYVRELDPYDSERSVTIFEE
jgi:hypothetical protein